MIRPSNNQITNVFSSSHLGIDFAGVNVPDPIYAVLDGNIIMRIDDYSTSWSSNGALTRDYGNFIKVKHDDGTYSLYAHLKKGSSLPIGTRVAKGNVIARIGNTGNTSGNNHLHFEYRNNQDIRVAPYFNEGGGNSMAYMYGGLNLDDRESMKPCVDLFNKWKAGGFVEKSKYDSDLAAAKATSSGGTSAEYDRLKEALKLAVK